MTDGMKPSALAPKSRGLSPLAVLDAGSIGGAPAWQVSWSSDGALLASCHGAPDPCVRIWRREPAPAASADRPHEEQEQDLWSLVATLDQVHTRTVRSVAFSPSAGTPVLASASFDGTVCIWEYFGDGDDAGGESAEQQDDGDGGGGEGQGGDARAGGWECTAQLEGHENEVKCVAWNGTGSLLATCGRDKSVWIWESFLPGGEGGAGYNPDAGGEGDGDEEFECIAVLHGHGGDVKCVEFAPSHGQWGDGDEVLLSASYDDTIKCWAEDGGDWYCAATLSAHSSTIWSVAAAPGGVRLVSGSADRSLGIWKCYTSIEKKELFPDSVETSEGDGLWKCVGQLPSAHSLAVMCVHCAPSRAGHGRIATSGSDNAISIFREVGGGTSDAPKFALDAFVDGAHSGDVNCVRWHPTNGSVLVSAGDDGAVRLWGYKA